MSRHTMRKSMTRILAILAIALMLTTCLTPYAFAMEVTHEIANTPTETKPPFSISPNDDITFEIIADFDPSENKPDEIAIDIHDCFLFVDIDEIHVYADGHEVYYTGIENIEKENESVKIYLTTLPDNANRIELYYTCTARDIVSIGPAGMYNTAHVITHVNNIRENESREVTQKSRAVYSWFLELWTIDSGKPRQTITTSNGSSNTGTTYGQDMHPGQSVKGASFEIYTDENLTNKLSFLPGFRRYTVCSDANAKHVDEIQLDNGGRAAIIGLKAGTYYIQETKPACEYENALSKPIEVQFTYDENELPEVKLVSLFDEATNQSKNIETRRGPQILIDYGDGSNALKNMYIAALTGTVLIIACIALYYTFKKKPEN